MGMIILVLTLSMAACGGGNETPQALIYTITGTISNGGTPHVGLAVQLTSAGTVATSGVTDSTGTYRLRASSGSYLITPLDHTWGFTPFAVTVNGTNTSARAITTVFPVYTITGKITKNGAPLPGITVSLDKARVDIYHIDTIIYGGTVVDLTTVTDATRVNPVTTVTMGDGSYTFYGNIPGCYIIAPINTSYNFNPIKTAAFTLTSSQIYLYNPEVTGNHLTTDGNIIYNSTLPYSENSASIQDFTAEVKTPVIVK